MDRRLFVVSNRLPLTVEQKESEINCRQSSGGLVSSITDYLNHGGAKGFECIYWVGVPGCSNDIWNEVADAPSDFTYVPVFMPDDLYESYYAGFSNSVLWPLFHYFPSFADYTPAHFEAYQEANRIFANALSSHLRKDDVVWIHDYHLLPLAALLREAIPGITIGFFLHIPFPSHELFRVMPREWQQTLLTGILGADLAGFHTVEYASHFLSCLESILDLEHDGQIVQWGSRRVKVDAFPISIDFDRFNSAGDNPETEQLKQKYLQLKGDRKMIFSADRLDYTKGISNRLNGFERFLEENPEYHEKVVFVLNLVPSRDAISRYAERKRLIDEYIGNLNSRLGTITWQPVIYQYNHLSFEELTALYLACDLALITPLRDGMNLVAKEFVACRKDMRGVLVLSEMAGSAKELTDALLINPNDIAEISTMIRRGLEMPELEQQERMASMQARVAQYNVVAWAADFFKQLIRAKNLDQEFETRFMDKAHCIDLNRRYSEASKRLILLDYDGSLVPFARRPEAAAPDNKLLRLLEILAAQQSDVFVVSGRDSQTLENWLGHLPIGLIAEHGVKIRHAEGNWELAQSGVSADWKQRVERLMDDYVARCPHSFVEHKEFSIAWHYRAVPASEQMARAKEVYEDLKMYTAQLPLQVIHGNKVIEVRRTGINKGTAVMHILHSSVYDFILCVGDDKTDEDMFRKLLQIAEAYTIKVGSEASLAKYNLQDPAAVRSMLTSLAEAGEFVC